jgi:hypothetical protein
MTPRAQKIFESLTNEYIKAGYPRHRTWSFSPGPQENIAVFQELRARGYIETMGMGDETWRLTDAGVDSILSEIPMSRQAEDSIAGIKKLYTEKGFPRHRSWWFQPSPGEEAAYEELRARGYIETMGMGNETWRLTDYGQADLMNG